MVSDRRLEDFHIERFLACAGLSPDEPLQPFEAPDCILRFGGNRVGLEHTEFFFPLEPGEVPQQQVDALQELSVEQARQLFRQRGGPALYVYPIFNDDRTPRTKREAYDLAERLAELVARNGWPQAPETRRFETWRHLPEIYSYTVMASVNGEDELWTGGRGAMVVTVEAGHVQACLKTKAYSYKRYLQAAPEVWLLVVNDMARHGVPCEISSAALAEAYTTPFDRVFWLESLAGNAIELRKQCTQCGAS